MKNLKIYLPLADGSVMDLPDYSNGIELIHKLISDDFGPPPTSLQIQITHTDGKKYNIAIPYDKGKEAFFYVSDE